MNNEDELLMMKIKKVSVDIRKGLGVTQEFNDKVVGMLKADMYGERLIGLAGAGELDFTQKEIFYIALMVSLGRLFALVTVVDLKRALEDGGK